MAEFSKQAVETLLTCLVDTRNKDIRQLIFQRLLELIPIGHHPQAYIEGIEDPGLRVLVRENYSTKLNEVKLAHDLKTLVCGGQWPLDLEMGSFLIARLDEDTAITPEYFSRRLDELAEPLRSKIERISERQHSRRVDVFCNYLFRDLGFSGDTENYYEPRNSFITRVLESKCGIPVSLSVICLLLARRLKLPLYGVNFPGHFIVAYAAEDFRVYIDPFNSGNLLSERDCLDFLIRQGLEPIQSYLSRASSLTIMKRMYRNLLNYHSAMGNVEMEKVLRRHFSILENYSYEYSINE